VSDAAADLGQLRSLVSPAPAQVDPLLQNALAEDLGRAGDLTTQAIISAGATGTGRILARAEGRVAGIEVALRVFQLLDPAIRTEIRVRDGQDAGEGAVLAEVSGSVRTMLSGERTALNLLGRLTGIATATRRLVRQVEGTGARVCDTRKTTPGLRALEKYAVRCGGGDNHRFGLDDAVLIKDNHVAAAGSVAAAIELARQYVGHMVKIEVEVDTLKQLDEALAHRADIVLLDNFTPEQLREAVERVDGRAILEASGGIGPATIREVAEAGVDLISVGWITHSAPSLDVSLDLDA
jgi:nicotinate-nucleotide pyrophosphorylase (carboxylating)